MAGFFDTLFGGGAQKDAAAQNMYLLQNYFGQGNQDLANAFGPSLAALQPAVSNYQGLQGKYGAGTDLYLNALGVNGPAGAAQAQSAFTNAPGYQMAVDQGLQGIARMRSLAGMGNSGNADIDALKFSQNLQNQQYNTWLSGLQGLISPEFQAAGGAAGAGTNIANLYQGNVANQIGLLSGLTSGGMAQNNLVAQGQQQGANNILGAIGGAGKLLGSFLA